MGKQARINAARKQLPVEADKVAFGYVHSDQVSVLWHTAFMRTVLWDKAGPNRLVGGAGKFSSANISNARNDVVRQFLAMPSKPTWLWMVDTDMEWEHDALERLVRSAYDDDGELKAHVVGGLCFGVNDGRLFPTLYAVDKTDAGEIGVFRYSEYPRPETPDEDCMFQVAATGAAFLLIHREVLDRMEPVFNRTYPWFQETELDGKTCGEDFTFCLRAGQLGYPVWVNTAVRVGHHKSYVLVEDMFLAQQPQPSLTGVAADG